MAGEAHKPTKESIQRVADLAAFGIQHEGIAKLLGISIPTLKKYYQEQLETGLDSANEKVANTLFRMATSGEHPAATFFWLKTRAKWRETDDDKQTLEITVNGQPTKTNGKD